MKLRLGTLEDYDDICEISSKIWEGDDYIPFVYKKWMESPDEGECIVAEIDNKVVGITKTTFLGDVAWFEGIRVHYDYRGRKIGKALADEQFKRAFEGGYSRIELSSYIDNTESLAMIESKGFKRIGEWIHMYNDDFSSLPMERSYETKTLALSELYSMNVYEKMNKILPLDFILLRREALEAKWREEISVMQVKKEGVVIGKIAWMDNIKYPDQCNIIAIECLHKEDVGHLINSLRQHIDTDKQPIMAMLYPEMDETYQGLLSCGFESEHNGRKNVFHYQYNKGGNC